MTTLKTSKPTFSKEKAAWMFEKMSEIRHFENKVHEVFSTGVLPGFVHLYAGEEAVAVGVCAHLNEQDSITSTHRGHGHCIAKGCDLNGMMAEIYGKATGLCNGKGGSMHIADVEKGMLGANGIVGGGFPLATGAALTAKVKKNKAVAVCFFGDGANNHGTSMKELISLRFGNFQSFLLQKTMDMLRLLHLNMHRAVQQLQIERLGIISQGKL